MLMPTAKRYKRSPEIKMIDSASDLYQNNLRQYGGWDQVSRTLTPINYAALHKQELQEDKSQFGAEWVLDCMTLAIEDGRLGKMNFPESVFFSSKDFELFCQELENYGVFWVTDRHFLAMEALGLREASMLSYPMIGKKLRNFFLENADQS